MKHMPRGVRVDRKVIGIVLQHLWPAHSEEGITSGFTSHAFPTGSLGLRDAIRMRNLMHSLFDLDEGI